MNAPLEQNPSTSEVVDEAAVNGTENPKGISAACKELSGITSRGVASRTEMNNVGGHYVAIVYGYHHICMMERVVDYSQKLNKVKSEKEREELGKQVQKDIDNEYDQMVETAEAWRKIFEKKEKKVAEHEVLDKAQEINGIEEEEECEVPNGTLEEEEFTLKLELEGISSENWPLTEIDEELN